MVLVRFGVLVLLLAAAIAVGHGQSSPVNQPWPPGVQRVADDSPPLAPAEAVKTFYLPPGYRLEVVASEPLVQDPTAVDWDPSGRLWVVEMTGFVRDLEAPEPNFDPTGRVVVLEDTNGDGRMDKRTVFADGLILPRAVKVLEHGVIIGEPGNLYWLRDTNGDLRADTKELLTSGYGRLHGSVEGNANSLYWAIDNRIHTTSADLYLTLKDGVFGIHRTLSRGEWGATQDDAGRIYRNSSESALQVDLVPTPYFARNPLLLRTRGSYEPLRGQNDEINTVWPVRPTPGTNRAYQLGIARADGTLERNTAACAPLVYRGDRLPADLYGNVFVAEPAANLVSRIILSDDGGTITARKAYENAEFLASTDERFRPVYLSNAPDGTLYVVDFYRGILQNRASTTVYLREYIVRKRLEQPTGMGRIYRVVHDTTRRDVAPPPGAASAAGLVDTLTHPNGWRRDTAQRLLVERVGRLRDDERTAVVASLDAMARNAPDWRARLHALWTLDGLDRIQPSAIEAALEDPARDVRAAAIRISERWLGEPRHPIHAAVLRRLDDRDWAVTRQLAASLGALPAGQRESAIVALLDQRPLDSITMDAALSGLRGAEEAALDNLLAGEAAETPQRSASITMLAAMIVRGGQETATQNLFARIGDDARAAWKRAAILRGAEVSVAGGQLPGPPPPRGRGPAAGVTVPCPTCEGARGGPGGAYAFPGVREAQQAPAAGRGGTANLRLNRQPAALSAVAAGGGELAPRAAALLARIDWPDKPGARTALPALTPAEQQRFDAGREIYRNICESCHQPDGRGRDRVAPSLIGSDLVLGPSALPARILLNGKEGPVGLMPSLGATLSDDAVAAVLTYVRREWGQTGSPVEPGTIRDVRAGTANRVRPWTNDELQRLTPPAPARGGQ
jgi:mono/diheme cytochrome c family protein/glucose/arabinose dehydrogenase